MGGPSGRLHRPCCRSGKKAESLIFPFDLANHPPITRAHAAFAAMACEVVFTVDLDVKIAGRRCLTLVILGRGTWAAARYATYVKAKP